MDVDSENEALVIDEELHQYVSDVQPTAHLALTRTRRALPPKYMATCGGYSSPSHSSGRNGVSLPYARMTAEQRQILEDCFLENTHPDKHRIEELSQQLGINPQVGIRACRLSRQTDGLFVFNPKCPLRDLTADLYVCRSLRLGLIIDAVRRKSRIKNLA